jgi:uncharacterized protein (DUF58 family)
MPIRVKNIRILLFGFFFIYLAGSYFGGYLFVLYYFALLFPLLSIALCIYSLFGLKYHQYFDTEHPVKGQDIHYRLTLSNESVVPVSHLHCRFKTINPHLSLMIPNFSAYIKARDQIEKTYTFRCSYRGVYTVGLERIEVEDPLKLFAVRPGVEFRTFYVYPRILALNHFALGLQTSEGIGSGTSTGGDPDYSLYTQFKDYRPGEPIRHMHWKKFAAIGKPYVKEFETTSEPGLSIYFDLRTTTLRAVNPLEIEDTSVEILVALVKYFLDREVPVHVTAPGREIYEFRGSAPDQFDPFYKSTMRLFFQDTVSPSQMYLADTKAALVGGDSVFFITHLMDASLFNLIETSLATDQVFTLIFNQVGYSKSAREKNLYYINRLRERGARIFVVNSPETIVEDLEGTKHEVTV